MGNDWPWKLTIAVLSVVTLTWLAVKRRRRWRPVGKLSNIYIYPLKSGKYTEVATAECTPLGVRSSLQGELLALRDRVFVIYDEDKMELFTARKSSTLIFITSQPTSKNSMKFSHPDKKDIEVFIPNGKFDGVSIKYWRDEMVQIIDCGDDIGKWLSQLVFEKDSGLRMGYWPEDETYRRDVLSWRPQEIEVFKKFTNKYTGAFSDLGSYHLINQSSIDDFNMRIEQSMGKSEALNFRPNFVIDGAIPYEEDKWDRIKIGDAEFTNFRPCTRCIFTTIDHKTGEKHPRTEPLTTLRKYRTMRMLGESRIEASLGVMGIFLGLDKPGRINKGDTVFVS